MAKGENLITERYPTSIKTLSNLSHDAAKENFIYNGETIGILWEISWAARLSKPDIGPMPAFLLERGKFEVA